MSVSYERMRRYDLYCCVYKAETEVQDQDQFYLECPFKSHLLLINRLYKKYLENRIKMKKKLALVRTFFKVTSLKQGHTWLSYKWISSIVLHCTSKQPSAQTPKAQTDNLCKKKRNHSIKFFGTDVGVVTAGFWPVSSEYIQYHTMWVICKHTIITDGESLWGQWKYFIKITHYGT